MRSSTEFDVVVRYVEERDDPARLLIEVQIGSLMFHSEITYHSISGWRPLWSRYGAALKPLLLGTLVAWDCMRCVAAAVGRRVGRGPVRLGADPDAPWVERHVALHAHAAGFDLHAGVHVAAGDRSRLEQLCRYVCRPPLGQRLTRLVDGRLALALQRPWTDGTTHLVFTPAEFLARLVPLVPRPRRNVLRYRKLPLRGHT